METSRSIGRGGAILRVAAALVGGALFTVAIAWAGVLAFEPGATSAVQVENWGLLPVELGLTDVQQAEMTFSKVFVYGHTMHDGSYWRGNAVFVLRAESPGATWTLADRVRDYEVRQPDGAVVMARAGWPWRTMEATARWDPSDRAWGERTWSGAILLPQRAGTVSLGPTRSVPPIERVLPLRPLPWRFVASTLVIGAVLLGAPALGRALRRAMRVRRGLCGACGYDARGLAICPECGAARQADPRASALNGSA